MTRYEQLTEEQKKCIDSAVKNLDIDIIEFLDYGEEIKLNDKVTLSHYFEDDVIVMRLTKEWIEVFKVLYNNEEDKIIYESL